MFKCVFGQDMYPLLSAPQDIYEFHDVLSLPSPSGRRRSGRRFLAASPSGRRRSRRFLAVEVDDIVKGVNFIKIIIIIINLHEQISHRFLIFLHKII